MARVGVSITKSTAFRNSTQEFSNVYYFDTIGSLPSQADAESLIDALTAAEKTFHSSLVTFVRGRLWSQGGSPGSNNMIAQKNLSGTGARATAASLDKERAFLFRLRAGSDSRGQPVYLRKWFHACGVFFSGQTISGTTLDNTSGFSSGDRASMVSAMNTIGQFTVGGQVYTLCSKAGRFATSGASWEAHPFLEHHQFGDMWRAQ